MDTFLGSLVQLCCGEGGTLQTNITGMCGECFSPTGFAPAHGMCAFMVYTSQALGCYTRNCLGPALGCLHFPGTSRSGSGIGYSTKVQTLLGLRFVPFPDPSSSGDQVLGEHSHPQVGGVSYHLPHPSQSVFWLYIGHTFSGVPCVPSGELISGCDHAGRCLLSRIPRSLG